MKAQRQIRSLMADYVADPSENESAFPESPSRMRGEKGPTRIKYIEQKAGNLCRMEYWTQIRGLPQFATRQRS